MLGVSIVMIITSLVSNKPPGSNATFIAEAAIAAIAAIWTLASIRDVLPTLRRVPPPLWLLGAVAAAVPTYALATAVVTTLQSLGADKLEYTRALEADGFGFRWAIILICLQPAIFEELAFRGVIQTALLRAMGPIETLFVTSLMFGILHLSIPSMPHLVTLGLVVGWMRLKTGSIYPGMITHFTHNLLVILAERSGGILPW